MAIDRHVRHRHGERSYYFAIQELPCRGVKRHESAGRFYIAYHCKTFGSGYESEGCDITMHVRLFDDKVRVDRIGIGVDCVNTAVIDGKIAHRTDENTVQRGAELEFGNWIFSMQLQHR